MVVSLYHRELRQWCKFLFAVWSFAVWGQLPRAKVKVSGGRGRCQFLLKKLSMCPGFGFIVSAACVLQLVASSIFRVLRFISSLISVIVSCLPPIFLSGPCYIGLTVMAQDSLLTSTALLSPRLHSPFCYCRSQPHVPGFRGWMIISPSLGSLALWWGCGNEHVGSPKCTREGSGTIIFYFCYPW